MCLIVLEDAAATAAAMARTAATEKPATVS
jgi:hypothetical protein